MKELTLFRMAGASACLAGALRIVAAFTSGDPTTANEVLYLVIDLAMLFAVIGVYASESARTGVPGLLGFLVATAGTALIVGPDVELGGVDLYFTGSLMIAFGLAALSVTSWRRGNGRSWVAAFYCTSVPVGMTGYSMNIDILFIMSGVLFGLGLVGSGVELPKGHGQRVRPAERAR